MRYKRKRQKNSYSCPEGTLSSSIQSYTPAVSINFFFHHFIPSTELRVLESVFERVTALDTSKNTINSEIGQIGISSTHEISPSRVNSPEPVVNLVVKRLPYVVFQMMPLFETLADKPHRACAHIYYHQTLPPWKVLLPSADLKKIN